MTEKQDAKSVEVDAMVSFATHIVHWCTGPVYCCENHASQLIGLGNFMGTHVIATIADSGHECTNCVNEKEQS